MRLNNAQGISLELTIDGYQYSESNEYWDANWLMVRGRVEHPLGSWTFRDPCLTTFELEQLATWFRGVADGKVDPDIGYFTEPNLHFEFSATPEPSIRVTLAYESAPPWIRERESRLEGMAIAFPLALIDPSAAIRSIVALLAKYPIRERSEKPA